MRGSLLISGTCFQVSEDAAGLAKLLEGFFDSRAIIEGAFALCEADGRANHLAVPCLRAVGHGAQGFEEFAAVDGNQLLKDDFAAADFTALGGGEDFFVGQGGGHCSGRC